MFCKNSFDKRPKIGEIIPYPPWNISFAFLVNKFLNEKEFVKKEFFLCPLMFLKRL